VSVFVDTSAILALLHADDANHDKAAAVFRQVVERAEPLVTTNYCILEVVALLQHRFGPPASRRFHDDVLPILGLIWVDADLHAAGMAALLTASRRTLSLVDCVSFCCMRTHGIERAFHFDRHFREQGFSTP
jgi:predicted nucleic acid-binding protein